MIQTKRFIYDRDTALVELNRKLGSACVPHLIDEPFIVEFHSTLTDQLNPDSAYFWLLYARITEAALLLAGNYADNCEFSAAGDLLVNPRRVVAYNRETGQLTCKKRHGSVSGQLKPENMPVERFLKNFSSRMNLLIAEPALLPSMADALERSDRFSPSYLASLVRRMQKIADAITFLLSWPVETGYELQRRLASATPETAHFIKRYLCRFSASQFDALGVELQDMESRRPATSRFLKEKNLRRMAHTTHGAGGCMTKTAGDRELIELGLRVRAKMKHFRRKPEAPSACKADGDYGSRW